MDEAAAASIALNCRDAGLYTMSGEEKGESEKAAFQTVRDHFHQGEKQKQNKTKTFDHNPHLRDFFREPSLDRALVAVVGLDDRFRFDLDDEVERP